VQAAIRGLAGSKVMTLDLFARIRDSLLLNDLSVKTQDAYLRAVRLVCAQSRCCTAFAPFMPFPASRRGDIRQAGLHARYRSRRMQ